MASDDEPVRLLIASNEPEAEIVCSLLRADGLRCAHRITDLAFGSGGELPSSGAGPREVLVRQDELERAREVLAAATQSADDPNNR
jgi:hypothetical protein